MIEVGEFSLDLEAVLVLGFSHEVYGHVFDDGHVFGTVAGAQSGEIIAEDDIEDPVETVFDVPVGAHGAGEGLGVEPGRGEVVAFLAFDLAVALDLGLDPGDHGEVGEAGFVGVAAVGEEPVDVVADGVASKLDAAMVAVGGLEAIERTGLGVGEEASTSLNSTGRLALRASR